MRPATCSHPHRPHYAHGVCQSCYRAGRTGGLLETARRAAERCRADREKLLATHVAALAALDARQAELEAEVSRLTPKTVSWEEYGRYMYACEAVARAFPCLPGEGRPMAYYEAKDKIPRPVGIPVDYPANVADLPLREWVRAYDSGREVIGWDHGTRTLILSDASRQ